MCFGNEANCVNKVCILPFYPLWKCHPACHEAKGGPAQPSSGICISLPTAPSAIILIHYCINIRYRAFYEQFYLLYKGINK